MADPITAILAGLASILGPALGSALQPKPKSFTDQSNKDIDPRNMLSGALASLNSDHDMIRHNIDKGVFFPSSYAQSPPSFTGGGLPMPFGLTGSDPALSFAGQAPGNRGGRNPLFLPGPDSSYGGTRITGGVTSLPETPIRRTDGGDSGPGANPGPDTGVMDDTNGGDARTGGTFKASMINPPQLKIGGDHEKALAAFRMLGLNV